jgi:hypothetical protein
MIFARNPAYNYSDLMRRIAKRLNHADAIVRARTAARAR